MDVVYAVLFLLSLLLFSIGMFSIHIYGVYLGFKKKWYFGLMGLTIPWFSTIIAISKIFFKKDLLE